MAVELNTPQTDQEYQLCWRIYVNSSEHATKKELAQQMSVALHEHRNRQRRRMGVGEETT